MDNTVLHTKALAVGYKNNATATTVAEHINIHLQQGQLIGLVGANGIGKSTLLRTLINVQPAISGDIFINKAALSTISAVALAKQLSVVLTEKVASKNLSVTELIALGRHPYTNWIGTLTETDKHCINRAIEQTHIEDLRHKKCYELSDGQLQKVMIARALAQDTDLIILDEPTTHLDMYHKAYILKLLQRLAKETNKTILFSSHEIDLAIQLCDSLIVMTDKAVIQDTPEQLLKDGVFNTLFPDDLIVFDKATGSFRVTK